MIKIITIEKNNMMKEELIEEFKCYRSSISRFKDFTDDEILEFLNQGYIKLIEVINESEKLLGIAHVLGDIEIIIDFLPLFDEADKYNNKLYIRSIIELLEKSIKYSLSLENPTKLLSVNLNTYVSDNNLYLSNMLASLGYKYYNYNAEVTDDVVHVLYSKKYIS